MLTRPYRLRGRVEHGAGRGRQVGVPTANLAGVNTLMPAVGVYAGRALVDGQFWPAAIHIGPNPTFHEQVSKLEVHLIGYDGGLYDRWLEVDFLARLRDIQAFGSVDELRRQLAWDVQSAAAVCQQAGNAEPHLHDSQRDDNPT
jgi:riboflavin kinase/FMN adenylyltransferase